MGKKVFVSYKYKDAQVKSLNVFEKTQDFFGNWSEVAVKTTARHYVDEIEKLLESEDHLFKGEDDGEDLGTLADSTIGSKLGDKIFDSTVTIVLISKGMKDDLVAEKDQWIPWEISYSLKEQTREGKRSKTNAVLAVVLPDELGNYDYYIKDDTCPHCNCRTLLTNRLFQILKDNMFNIKKPIYLECDNHIGSSPYKGNSSYIYSVKWMDFICDVNKYIEKSLEIRKNINEYNLTKIVK